MDPIAFKEGKKVTLIGFFGNVALTILKFVLGIVGKSSALVADAVHSLTDVLTTAGVYFGLRLAANPKDEDHPHGHAKIESLVALFVGLGLAATGIYLIYENTFTIYSKNFIRPELITLIAALLSIVGNEWMYRFTLATGEKINSPSIVANAHEHRSDAFTSVGVFFGILGAIIGFPILDPIAAVLVAIAIIKMAYEIARDAIFDLIDTQMPEKILESVKNIVNEWNTEYSVVEAIGRRMGTKYQVSLQLKISPYVSAVDGVSDFRNLEEYIKNNIELIQGVDIRGYVDSADIASTEKQFRKFVKEVLEKYESLYADAKNLEFHFLENQQEVHFDLFVDPEMSVKEAHDITDKIEDEIIATYKQAQVVIHIEPAE